MQLVCTVINYSGLADIEIFNVCTTSKPLKKREGFNKYCTTFAFFLQIILVERFNIICKMTISPIVIFFIGSQKTFYFFSCQKVCTMLINSDLSDLEFINFESPEKRECYNKYFTVSLSFPLDSASYFNLLDFEYFFHMFGFQIFLCFRL